MTTNDPESLSAREKEALRLLLIGYDAKSIASTLGLSVHTINDRLRDARRKLGVSSSLDAGRRLARMEGGAPNSVSSEEIGDAEARSPIDKTEEPALLLPPGYRESLT